MSSSKKIIINISLLLIAVFSVLVAVVAYEELERNRLISGYTPPSGFVEKIIKIDKDVVDNHFHDDEILVCAINSYSKVDDIDRLSVMQKKSMPKRSLPSQDMSWYLIFFSEQKVSRVYLINSELINGLTNDSAICAERGWHMSIEKIERSDRSYQYNIKFEKKNG